MNNFNKIPIHDSSLRHSTGQAVYIDDMPEQENLLHAAPILSKIACGKIININSDKLNNLPFFTKVITAKDIPGENEIGPIKNGEPVLADDYISYLGQPIGIVLAETHQEAIYATSLVEIETEITTKPILNLDDAFKQKSFLENPMILEKGNVESDMAKSNYKLSGDFEIGGQDHFYLETHVAMTLPGENEEYVVW